MVEPIMSSVTGGQAAGVGRSLRTFLDEWPLPEPYFPKAFVVADNYDDLFDASEVRLWDEAALVQAAMRRGRILIHGEAGCGKTTLIRSLLESVARDGWAAFFIDAKLIGTSAVPEWEAYGDNDYLRMDLLLALCATPASGQAELNLLASGKATVIAIDGLDELSDVQVGEVLGAVDDLARRNSNVGIMLCDRMVRRDVSNRWTFARLLGVDANVLPSFEDRSDRADLREAHPDGVLVSAWEAQRTLQLGGRPQSRAHATSLYFQNVLRLDEQVVDRTAEAVYDAVLRGHSIGLSEQRLTREMDEVTVQHLVDHGLLHRYGYNRLIFDHRLNRDFLVASHLARHSRKWTTRAFDRLSRQSASIDALALALEQLDQSAAERFFRRLYEWSMYDSALVLAKTRPPNDSSISHDMRLAVMASLAERQWDRLKSTARQSRDVLLRFERTPLLEQLLRADSVEEVLDALDGRTSSDWLRSWLTVFSGGDERPLSELLTHGDALLAWAAANAAKRQPRLGLLGEVRALLGHEVDAVRWRAVHVLGAVPALETTIALLDRLVSDGDDRVRAGAMRSLIESAALGTAEARELVRQTVEPALQGLVLGDRVLEQFARAIFIAPVPQKWDHFVSPLLDAVARNLGDVDREWALRVVRRFSYWHDAEVKRA